MITRERLCLVSFGVDEETGEPTINVLKTIQWQELTIDEIQNLWLEAHHNIDNRPIPVIFASLVEQALKEKNHG